MKFLVFVLLLITFNFSLTACSGEDIETGEVEESLGEPARMAPPAQEEEATPACVRSLYYDQLQPYFLERSCAKATKSQIDQVNKGNAKKDLFLSLCYKETNNSCWCDQLIRPNPESLLSFQCTYGEEQAHQLIHPDESTWKYAYEAVKIVEELETQNIYTEIIYNWWRPEPYNKNVGGAAGRHPFGTSVDVRFKTKDIQNLAFQKLCQMRAKGRIRAVGYYATTAIHFGVGDNTANTWGKNCP